MRSRQVSSSMQRSIDRLLKSTLDDANNLADGTKGKVIGKDGKIKFDRQKYDLDTYKTILEKIEGFDYRETKGKATDGKKSALEDISSQKSGKSIDYNDDLT